MPTLARSNPPADPAATAEVKPFLVDRLRDFYTIEAEATRTGNMALLDVVPPDFRADVDVLRRGNALPPPGMDNWKEFEGAAPGAMSTYVPPPPTPTETPTTTSPVGNLIGRALSATPGAPSSEGRSRPATPEMAALSPIGSRMGGMIPANPGPGYYNRVGSTIGGLAGGAALPALMGVAAMNPMLGIPLGIMAALAGAQAGGMGGEGIQALLEQLNGSPGSMPGTTSERMANAGREQQQMEGVAQAVMAPFRVGGAIARPFTPTARIARAVAPLEAGRTGVLQAAEEAAGKTATDEAAQNAWRQLTGAAALGQAEKLAPQARRIARNAEKPARVAIAKRGVAGEAADTARQLETAAATPGGIVRDTSTTFRPTVDRALSPDPLLEPAAKAARKQADRLAKSAKTAIDKVRDPLGRVRSPDELAGTLRPVLTESPADSVLALAKDPDLARAMLTAAKTPRDRALVQKFVEAGGLVNEIGLMPGKVVNKQLAQQTARKTAGEGVDKAVAEARARASRSNQTIRRAAQLGLAVAGVSGGAYVSGKDWALAGLGAAAAEPILRNVLDTMLNSTTAPLVATALTRYGTRLAMTGEE